jgi:alanyl-tRNA synthetase
MLSKEKLREEFSKDYKRFYEVELFKELGFERKKCSCGKYFWSLGKENCGDPDEHGLEYSFFKKHSEITSLDEMWKRFSEFFKKNGHEEINRYPVVSRWRPDLYFTIASIQDFQRIEKDIMDFEYPANPLIVPQVCLRFNDIPHVGFTGRHLSSFIMAGQHSFNWPKEGYWRDETIRLDFEFLTKELGIKKEEITFIEDVWAMNDFSEFGACLEAFSKGLEIVNAVFTEFSYLNEIKELPKKVVDVGWGFERVVWFKKTLINLHEWEPEYQKEFYLWALLEQEKLCLLKQLQVKQVSLSSVFQALILLKCLLELVHQESETFLKKVIKTLLV